MALFSIAHVRIRAVAAAVPARKVHNEELDLLEASDVKSFVKSVGISVRRVATPSICASDLCVEAARILFERLELRPADIGILVFVTETPDYPIPGNSMLAQQRLGLSTSTYLLDLNQGCAGYVYGLATLAGLMSSSGIERGLLLAGDTITRILSSKDRSTVPIFSDAGSATLVERDLKAEPMHFNLESDGRGADVIQVRSGGARQPFISDVLSMSEECLNGAGMPMHLSMRGMDVLHYSLKYVPANIKQLLAFANGTVGKPDYYLFHQANRILNESLTRSLGLPAEKVPETLSEYGNTSCATIPVTICSRLGQVLAQGSKRLLIAGFGAGFSWGSALIKAESVLCPETIELDGSQDGI